MATKAAGGPAEADFSACDSEPIHRPGSIQPHGTLLVLDAAGDVVRQAAANVRRWLGRDPEEVIGRTPEEIFGQDQGAALRAELADASLEQGPLLLRTIAAAGRSFHAVAHRLLGVTILELEEAGGEAISFRGLYPLVRTFLARLTAVATSRELGRLAAEEVRRITGFDRVLLYRFDGDGHGTVVAEDRNDTLPSYLDLRFPASDIPRQARELYRVHRLRLIADAGYSPVPIVPAEDPATGRALDLSYAALRSVSPVHVQYMKNMGTAASMSISVLRGGELWGLISCHSKAPRVVPFEIRTACDFLGQVLSAHLEVKEHNEEFAERMRLKGIESRLLRFMAEEEFFIDGLRRHPAEMLEFAGATGAAVVVGEAYTLLGQAPAEARVRRIVDWLAEEVREDVFQTDSLPALLPAAEEDKDRASGLLAVSISKLHRSYVLWFRPEVIRTVEWGGDPRPPVGEGGQKLGPRHSFETWKETVRLRSMPWRPVEAEAAGELRNAIVNIVLRKAEELAAMSEELTRSNKELEAFSYSVSHDLRAPLRHVVGYAELLRDEAGERIGAEGRRYVDTIIESANYAGTLVDNLLGFSRVGRTALIPVPVDMNRLVDEVKRDVMAEAGGRAIRWTVGDLPEVTGDLMMLRLALTNLLSNAVKYTRTTADAAIEIGCASTDREHVFSLRDNGVGFDMKYADKLFGIFQRLHRWEDFEGTGIGLANVRRIVERHRGRAWAEGAVGAGATFSFSLPRDEP